MIHNDTYHPIKFQSHVTLSKIYRYLFGERVGSQVNGRYWHLFFFYFKPTMLLSINNKEQTFLCCYIQCAQMLVEKTHPKFTSLHFEKINEVGIKIHRWK